MLAIGLLCLGSFIGVATPIMVNKFGKIESDLKFGGVMNFFKLISVGTIFGLALIHMLPDANEDMKDLAEYPIAYTVASSFVFVMLIVDILIHGLKSDTDVIESPSLHACSHVNPHTQSGTNKSDLKKIYST